MEQSDIQKIVLGLKDSIDISVKESVYQQLHLKDREVSSLHRQINDRMAKMETGINGISDTVGKHDEVIAEIVKVYNTSSKITKFITRSIMWILLFVPTVGAFVASVYYIYGIFKTK